MSKPTVRISPAAHARLKSLADKSGESMQAVVERAIAEEERRRFFAEVDEAYARLRDDPDAWQEYRAEMDAWDATLMDGLEPEAPNGLLE